MVAMRTLRTFEVVSIKLSIERAIGKVSVFRLKVRKVRTHPRQATRAKLREAN